MKPKRRRAPPDPFTAPNANSDDQFIADYLKDEWITEWTHPKVGDKYTIDLVRVPDITVDDLEACFNLIKETSQKDYENSRGKWHPDKKKIEMASPGLRYILVRDENSSVRGFTSLMPTFEEGQPVIYCYEIHLKPELQGTGLASLLMNALTTIARNLPPVTKVMLTVFLANQRAQSFYKKLGFNEDAISPVPRKLRYGKIFTPDYVIMSKRVREDPKDGDVEEATPN